MCLRSRLILLIVSLVFTLPLVAVPNTAVEAQPAARKVTITITEVQFNRFIRTLRKPRDTKSLVVDIIDGGFIVKFLPLFPSDPEEHQHFGVLIRDGKVVTEPGVWAVLGIGAWGLDTIRQVEPELGALLDRNAQVVSR